MPVARIKLEDGRIARFEVPEGTTEAQVMEFVAQNPQQFAPQAPQQPATRQTRRGERPVRSSPDETSQDIFEGLPDESIARIESEFPLPSGERTRGGQRIGVARRRKAAADLERIRLENPALADMIQNSQRFGGLESLAIGAGRGLTNLARGVGLAEPEEPAVTRAIEGLRTQAPVTAGEIIGESAPFLLGGPVAGAARTAAGRLAMGGALGGAEAGIIESGRGGDASDIVRSAVLGGITAGALSLGGARPRGASDEGVTQGARGATRQTASQGGEQASQRAADATAEQTAGQSARPSVADIDDNTLEQFFDDPTAFSDIQQNARRQAFERLGVTPTQAQVTRDPLIFQKQVDLFRDADQNNRVRRALIEQERILTDRVNGEIDAIGGNANRASTTPIETITNKSLELDSQIANLYRLAREAAPSDQNVRFGRTSRILRKNSPIDRRTDGTVSAVRGEMRRLGFLDEKGNPTRLTSVEASENLRQFVNSLFEGANPLARIFIREVKDSIDDDVMAAAGKDFFSQAREAKRNFMQGLEAKKGHKFDRRQVSLVSDILDGTVQPDDVIDKITSRGSRYKAKEIKELRNYFSSGTPEQIAEGARAWNDVRAAALRKIADTAFGGPLTEAGTQTLTRARLDRAFNAIGPQKMQILFTQKERNFLRDLARVSVLKEPVAGVSQSPSGPAIRQLENTVRSAIPALGEWVPNFRQMLQTRADEKAVLNLKEAAEEIGKQNEKRFAQRMRTSQLAVPGAVAVGAQQSRENDEEI